MRIGLVVPHIFMQDSILPNVIFSPGELGRQLADGLVAAGHDVTIFTPGPLTSKATNITPATDLFEAELAARGDTAIDLLKKHPLTFITLARQLQSQLIAQAYRMANEDKLDIVHIYTNEEETALVFAEFCRKPAVFTHHDPFNFLVRYKSVMPKYAHLNWISMSMAQRRGLPEATNWVGNVYHGLAPGRFKVLAPVTDQPYVVFLGRIIEPKGLHLAIQATKTYNRTAKQPLVLKIAGKHYSGRKDRYWQETILPALSDPNIEYLGFVNDDQAKNELLGRAQALVVPSTFQEPFGMVMIEALAAGTPVIGLDSGAISEVVKHGATGYVVPNVTRRVEGKETIDEGTVIDGLVQALHEMPQLNRRNCRRDFEARFTLEHMVNGHLAIYQNLISNQS